jgi:N6-L-threonylcarbamoyladenine synthase
MKTLVLAGGVAANSHLRMSLSELCQRMKVTFAVPPVSLCGDNGAMVAAAGYYAYLAGERAGTSLNASAI